MKTILVDAINTFVLKYHGIFKEMYDLLETYPNKKIIVTNASDEQIKPLGLDKLPYELFTLKHNPEKTNPEYFKTLLRKKQLEAKEVVYFEHNKQAVTSAQFIGIKTFYYDRYRKNLSSLKEFLDGNLKQ